MKIIQITNKEKGVFRIIRIPDNVIVNIYVSTSETKKLKSIDILINNDIVSMFKTDKYNDDDDELNSKIKYFLILDDINILELEV